MDLLEEHTAASSPRALCLGRSPQQALGTLQEALVPTAAQSAQRQNGQHVVAPAKTRPYHCRPRISVALKASSEASPWAQVRVPPAFPEAGPRKAANDGSRRGRALDSWLGLEGG